MHACPKRRSYAPCSIPLPACCLPAEKTLRSTVALTAARGRGKSAALGLAIAGALALGYSNIFVTAPSPENLRTLFEFVFKGLDELDYKVSLPSFGLGECKRLDQEHWGCELVEPTTPLAGCNSLLAPLLLNHLCLPLQEHIDYDLVESTNPAFGKAVVRVNVFRNHRQTVQYIQPQHHAKLAQAELLVIDEAAAIPLPLVKAMLGPYLVFLCSTGEGRAGRAGAGQADGAGMLCCTERADRLGGSCWKGACCPRCLLRPHMPPPPPLHAPPNPISQRLRGHGAQPVPQAHPAAAPAGRQAGQRRGRRQGRRQLGGSRRHAHVQGGHPVRAHQVGGCGCGCS